MSSESNQTGDHVSTPDGTTASVNPLPAKGALSEQADLTTDTFVQPNHPIEQTRSETTDRRGLVPGFEIEEEIGRGGMGVVYKARHTALNRVVALKMILRERAGQRDLIRFLAEAEAVAAIRHPNVVQVFEYGEANGSPYMALEYLSGGTLLSGLNTRSRNALEVAALVAQIAHGVAAAHELGIVHRDLKPANVLLDEAGNPKVTDFGLAKRVGGSALTATQAVLGTPAYMSPEQADGNTKFVGPPADVWALGVILYECLTTTRPFDAEDVQGILARILTVEPVLPHRLNAAIPPDLELICLKCLSKLPHERYPTANELAADLDRFVAGEPISVRPAGFLERGYKWAKRNPIPAGFLVVLAAAFAVVAGLALELHQSVSVERTARADAERANRETTAAQNDLKQVNDTLSRTNDELNEALAGAFLGPLHSEGRETGLTVYEKEAFQNLASQPRMPLGYRFLDRATATPSGCKQLECRAEYAFQAAIGLDQELRAKAEGLLAERLDNPRIPSEQQLHLVLASSRMPGLPPPLAARIASVLLNAMTATTTPNALVELSRGAATTLARMPPEHAAKLLTDAMTRTTDATALGMLGEMLGEVSERLPRDRANSACEAAASQLGNAMTKTTNGNHLRALSKGLAAVAEHTRPSAGSDSAVARILADAMSINPDYLSLVVLARSMAIVVEHTSSESAAKILVEALNRTTNEVALGLLAEQLGSVASRMTPNTAQEVCVAAVKPLIEVMTRPAYRAGPAGVSKGLGAVAAQMRPETAASMFLDAVARAPSEFAREELAEALATVASRMNPEGATTARSTAARILSEAIARTTNPPALRALSKGLAALVSRLPAEELHRICGPAAKTITELLERTTNVPALRVLAEGLSIVASRMPPEAAANALTEAMTRTTDSGALQELAETLSEVVGRMSPDAARRTTSFAASRLAEATNKPINGFALRELAKALVSIGERMPPDAAAKLLTDVLTKTTDTVALRVLAEGVGRVAARMQPEAAHDVCSTVAGILTNLMNGMAIRVSHSELAKGLATVAGGMKPEPAARTLTEAMTKTTDGLVLRELAEGLAAVAGRMTPAVAQSTSATTYQVLAEMLGKTTNFPQLHAISKGLAALASRMQPEAGGRMLIETMEKATNSRVLRELAEGVAGIAERMNPDAAARTCSAAARILTEAMNRATTDPELQELSTGLAAVAVRMNPVQAANTLLGEMGSDQAARRILSQALRGVVSGFPPLDRQQAWFLVVSGSPAPLGLLWRLPPLHPQFHPQPKPLPPQTLVDLLKHPFCVGEARRAVLDALEFTYNRKFADQWEFVQFVRDNKLPLDLLTPPKRPQLKA